MSNWADVLEIDMHTDTHTDTEAGNDKTWLSKLAIGKNGCENYSSDIIVTFSRVQWINITETHSSNYILGCFIQPF